MMVVSPGGAYARASRPRRRGSFRRRREHAGQDHGGAVSSPRRRERGKQTGDVRVQRIPKAAERGARSSYRRSGTPGELVAAELAQERPRAGAGRGTRRSGFYECDGLSATRDAVAAAIPADENQVAASRARADAYSGGRARFRARTVRRCLPLADGILLSLAKFNVHRGGRTLRARRRRNRASLTSAISQHRPLGLLRAWTSSQIACSIGGKFAENSGGVYCLHTYHCLNVNLEDPRHPIEAIWPTSPRSAHTQGWHLLGRPGSEALSRLEVMVKLLPSPKLRRS